MVAARPTYTSNGLECCGLNDPESGIPSPSPFDTLFARRGGAALQRRAETKMKFKGWIGIEEVEVFEGCVGELEFNIYCDRPLLALGLIVRLCISKKKKKVKPHPSSFAAPPFRTRSHPHRPLQSVASSAPTSRSSPCDSTPLPRPRMRPRQPPACRPPPCSSTRRRT